MREYLQIATFHGDEVYDAVEIPHGMTRRGQYNAQVNFWIQKALRDAQANDGKVVLRVLQYPD